MNVNNLLVTTVGGQRACEDYIFFFARISCWGISTFPSVECITGGESYLLSNLREEKSDAYLITAVKEKCVLI